MSKIRIVRRNNGIIINAQYEKSTDPKTQVCIALSLEATTSNNDVQTAMMQEDLQCFTVDPKIGKVVKAYYTSIDKDLSASMPDFVSVDVTTSDAKAVKELVVGFVGKGSYKLLKSKRKLYGLPTDVYSMIADLVKIYASAEASKPQSTEDGLVKTVALSASDLTEHEISELRAGRTPESVKHKLPKDAQAMLSSNGFGARVSSIDLSTVTDPKKKVKILEILADRELTDLSTEELLKVQGIVNEQ